MRKIKLFLKLKQNKSSRQKTGKIDYEEEFDYKDEIAKDDFFVVD